ncbi:hypothetical protein ACTQZR_13180 [Catenibacterium mitsuokai]|uniref:hypothetical protein n=1 Tax=Catenibacterium mitsuokai TaxID=100886 RepID=UPI003F927039
MVSVLGGLLYRNEWSSISGILSNKDEYIDRDYRVYIPEDIGYDLNIFAEQLSNIQILQNMLIEFRKENEI